MAFSISSTAPRNLLEGLVGFGGGGGGGRGTWEATEIGRSWRRRRLDDQPDPPKTNQKCIRFNGLFNSSENKSRLIMYNHAWPCLLLSTRCSTTIDKSEIFAQLNSMFWWYHLKIYAIYRSCWPTDLVLFNRCFSCVSLFHSCWRLRRRYAYIGMSCTSRLRFGQRKVWTDRYMELGRSYASHTASRLLGCRWFYCRRRGSARIRQ